MQPTGVSVGTGKLTKFRSAPATWLEALLESELEEEENDVVLDHHHHPTSSTSLLSSSSNAKPPLPSSTTPLTRFASADLSHTGGAGCFRQNSSPPEFLSDVNSDDYFSSFRMPGNYDHLLPSSLETSPNKRSIDELSSPSKGEQGVQLQGGLLDADMEKLSDESVLCRVRAKRGCATHPRSIAERVRRTRISDRMRKLQEIVPNMDKQTNTADMLEEAVEYVKLLQRQIQELKDDEKRCNCSMKQ